MDESSAELDCRKKSQKETKYEDILETLGNTFKCNYIATTQNAVKILQPFQFLKVPSHQHQQ